MTLLVSERVGTEITAGEKVGTLKNETHIADLGIEGISSSEIRKALRTGKLTPGLDPALFEAILKTRMYGTCNRWFRSPEGV